MNKKILMKHFGISEPGTYSDDLTRLWTESIAEDILDNELVAVSGAWPCSCTETNTTLN